MTEQEHISTIIWISKQYNVGICRFNLIVATENTPTDAEKIAWCQTPNNIYKNTIQNRLGMLDYTRLDQIILSFY